MKTRAILLAAAAVFLTAPAFADQNDNQSNSDKMQSAEQHQDARQDAAADKKMERRITRENINEFRANTNAVRRYHSTQTWIAPRGWRYQRFAYGQHMPSNYYGRNFWIVDFGGFGLYAPPDGYRWVRYGHDAVLVDLSTGEIIRVQYNHFY